MRLSPALVLATVGTYALLSAEASEIRVLSAAAVQVPVEEIAAAFARDTSHQVRFEFATAGEVEARVNAGARPAIVITAEERSASVVATLGLGAGQVRPLATVGIGVAVRRGAPKPDLSSVDAFRQSLRRAESVAYGDPSRGATTGVHFAKVLDVLGVADEIRPKTMLAANGLDVMRRVKSGEIELGVTQISEILNIDAAALVGLLPSELQKYTTYAAILVDPTDVAAADFIRRLVDEPGRARFRAAGFQ